MVLIELRKKIAEIGKYIYQLGLVTPYSGNISVRDPETGWIAIKPSGVHWMEITPEDVVIIVRR